MRDYDHAEIQAYIASGVPMDASSAAFSNALTEDFQAVAELLQPLEVLGQDLDGHTSVPDTVCTRMWGPANHRQTSSASSNATIDDAGSIAPSG